MSANVPVEIETREPFPDDAVLEAELRELAKQFPEPIWREVAEDREWFYTEAGKGALNDHLGKVVAVYQRGVVAAGDNYLVLLLDLVRRYQRHPGCFFVVYHGDPFEGA